MNNSSKLFGRLKDLVVASKPVNRTLFGLSGTNVAQATQAHSVLLANQQHLYELQSKLNLEILIFKLIRIFLTLFIIKSS